MYPALTAGREVLRRMVVNRGQPYRTVAERLGTIYEEAARSDLRHALEAAYDVEAVTKKFFREYSRIFELVRGMVEGDLSDDERKLFCQTLMNRLMFLYFLQKKGWLRFNNDTNYLHALWRDHQQQKDGNFYETRLRLLFFTALSNPRDANYDTTRAVLEPLIGVTPFLNGGLFEQTNLDKQSVHVPDTALNLILNDLFARFNFTIAESTPYDVEVAVDPEMLGKVFEELVTGRHQTGSYYTPRPIVSFMCREALKHHLQTRVPGLSAEVASAFIDDNRVQGLTVQQAGEVLRALETVTVLDPACGSGAYLLGMLHELIEQQRLLYNSDLIADAKSLYELKLRVIERNVYGVDIDPFAVNIAMLRLWLSLMIDWEGPGDPPALPNLAFKIVCGDSLLAPNPQEAGDIFRHAAHEQARDLAKLKAAFMRDTGESKREAERKVREVQASISAMLSHRPSPSGSVDWRVQFAEVFDSGGFDVVLANPPYVRMELFKDIKPILRIVYPEAHSDRADLYIYFYARALQLLTDRGMLVFISSNKWFRAKYGAKLRTFVAQTAGVLSITDFGDLPVFESASAYPMVFVSQKGVLGHKTRFSAVKSLNAPYPDIRAVIHHVGRDLPANAISGKGWSFADQILTSNIRSMRAASKALDEYVEGQILYGVKTGLNEAFVIDGVKRSELLDASPESAEVIKPFVVGRDTRKWHIRPADRWLLYMYHGIDVVKQSAVIEHLQQYRQHLERRATRQEWYELQQPQMRYAAGFEQPKIIYPVMARASAFAFDARGAFTNDKTFTAIYETAEP